MIDTGDICYGITVSMSVNFIYVETLPFNQHDLNTWIFLCLFKNELENVKVHYMEYATSGFNMVLLFCDEKPRQLLRFHALTLIH